jgi:hypothetical protein
MQVTHEIARKNLIKGKEEQKEKFDKKTANHVDFKEGMEVLLSNDASKIGVPKKLSFLWTGPYKIVRVNENGTLALQNIDKKNSKRNMKLQTVHANRIKPYFPPLFRMKILSYANLFLIFNIVTRFDFEHRPINDPVDVYFDAWGYVQMY